MRSASPCSGSSSSRCGSQRGGMSSSCCSCRTASSLSRRRSSGGTRAWCGCISTGSSTPSEAERRRCRTVTLMRPAWEPTARYLERSRLRRFAERHGHRDYASLLRWSTDDLEGFWRATERDLGIAWRVPYTHAVDQSRGVPWATWGTGGRMNYVAAALRPDPQRPAPIPGGEGGAGPPLTLSEPSEQGARLAPGPPAL